MYLKEFKSIWTFVTVYLVTLAWTSVSLAAFAVTTTVLQPNLTGTNLAILRQPEANPNAHIGIFIMHPDAGYSTFSACTGLAQRGFTTLCVDTVFNNRSIRVQGLRRSCSRNYSRHQLSPDTSSGYHESSYIWP